jgi:hypothetical protein
LKGLSINNRPWAMLQKAGGPAPVKQVQLRGSDSNGYWENLNNLWGMHSINKSDMQTVWKEDGAHTCQHTIPRFCACCCARRDMGSRIPADTTVSVRLILETDSLPFLSDSRKPSRNVTVNYSAASALQDRCPNNRQQRCRGGMCWQRTDWCCLQWRCTVVS